MMIPAPIFMLYHVGLVALIAMAYPKKYRPALYAFGAVQGIVEHYADVFPTVAAAGPFLIPIAIALLGLHYYFANQVIAKQSIVYGGLAFYIVLLVGAKGMDWGFPKDTAEEQIEALSDNGYVTKHFILHNLLISCLAITAFSLPKDEGIKKA